LAPKHHRFRGLGVAGFHELHYCEWGRRGAKRVVLCAHGYSGNARDFDELARSLSRSARVVCPDVAGRGESAWLGSPLEYNFPQFLADINALIARLGVKNVDWVGTSMGGLLGMLLAASPGSPIRRLVMNDVGAFLPMDSLLHIGRNLRAPDRFPSLDAVETHMRHTHREWGEIPDAQWRRLALHGSRKVGDGFRLHYDPCIARLVDPMPFAPGLFFWDAWYKVRCPVLLLRGELSTVFPRAVADTMLQVKPDAALVEIPGCGHAPSLMQRDQVEIVESFLAAPSARMRRPWRTAFPSSPSSRPAY
jgi:pimeloyl-ACP methyl ester carboxylesterase